MKRLLACLLFFGAVVGATAQVTDFSRYPTPTMKSITLPPTDMGSSGNVGKFSVPTAGGLLRSLEEKLKDLPTNVRDFAGFDPTGVNDSTAALQNAINSLPPEGGTVVVPCGSRIKLTATVQVHNGTASAYTTRNGTLIEGDCGTPASWSFSGALPTAAVPNKSVHYLWYGPANQPMMQVNGGDGWGVSNAVFDCRDSASDGLKVISASTGDSKRLAFLKCANAGIFSTTVPGIDVGGTFYKADSLRNHYTQIYVLPKGNAYGIILDGSRTANGARTTDTDFNLIENYQCQDQATSGNTFGCVLFGVSDSNIVRNFQCTLANSFSTCIKYDAQNLNGTLLPGSNLVDFVDWGGIPTNPVVVVENSGAPLAAFNFITNVLHVNGGDTRTRLHPKIFMTDGSVSITDETVQPKRTWLKTDGSFAANLYQENGNWKYYGNGPGMVWDYNSANGFFKLSMAAANSSGAGATATLVNSEAIYASGARQFLADVTVPTITTAVTTVGGLGPCVSGNEGKRVSVSDAASPAWNQTLVGGGTGASAHVGARCNGTTWVAD